MPSALRLGQFGEVHGAGQHPAMQHLGLDLVEQRLDVGAPALLRVKEGGGQRQAVDRDRPRSVDGPQDGGQNAIGAPRRGGGRVRMLAWGVGHRMSAYHDR